MQIARAGFIEKTRHQIWRGLQNRHTEPLLNEHIRGLQTDHAAADDDRVGGQKRAAPDGVHVFICADGVYAGKVFPGKWRDKIVRAHGIDTFAVGKGSGGGLDGLPLGVHGEDLRAQ